MKRENLTILNLRDFPKIFRCQKEIRAYSYSFDAKPPYLFNSREGIWLEGIKNWAEIAPLPTYSQETLQSLSLNTPSVSFGLHCLETPLPEQIPPLSFCRLIAGSDLFDQAVEAISEGTKTVKIKIGNLLPDEALRLIQNLQTLPCKLRIDINRKWPLEDAIRFLKQLAPFHIDYIEEPAPSISALEELLLQTPHHPIALDESLLDTVPEDLALRASAFILKPTLLGVDRLFKWIQRAKEWKKRIVFSSSFETGPALLHLASMQSLFSPEESIGLDTYRCFPKALFHFTIDGNRLISAPTSQWINTWKQLAH